MNYRNKKNSRQTRPFFDQKNGQSISSNKFFYRMKNNGLNYGLNILCILYKWRNYWKMKI